ncbi:uncharacterized protein BDR25DRAFT_209136 [Lindgomyces ingoldianus]|uniref:Uncharacterized protein n=1 Tax=Lindgomyces ingoldianus TaxID=673940 RepID=A0ACB6RFI5_9PLEO|nr:uncharacterized protein BDR25DRAFT_209136 [Lindgomyces ingoldianus]KAF2477231.1 hypothetical protein BDR25DRAFT_209136 [Lindgomyces ingoldianus]
MLFLHLLNLYFFLIPILAQNTTNTTIPSRFLLSFQLMQCSNGLDSTHDPDASPPGSARLWGVITLSAPNTSTQFATPQGSIPYHRWEAFNTSAFFYNTVDAPRGFVHVQIPTEAKGYKAYVAAGKVVFEGVDFPCRKEYGRGVYGGGAKSFDGGRYVYCSLR